MDREQSEPLPVWVDPLRAFSTSRRRVPARPMDVDESTPRCDMPSPTPKEVLNQLKRRIFELERTEKRQAKRIKTLESLRAQEDAFNAHLEGKVKASQVSFL